MSSSPLPDPQTAALAALRARLDAVEAENASLREQVKALVRTESKLYKTQEQLDLQLRVFRKLYELGQRLNLLREPRQILDELPKFVLYELGFQRCVTFFAGPGREAFTAQAWDGYYGDEWAERLLAVRVRRGDALLAARAGRALHTAHSPDEALGALASALDLRELLVCPLRADGEPVGLLVVGNLDDDPALYAAVGGDGEAAVVNLASLASAVLENRLLYGDLLEERTLLEKKVAQRTRELSEAYDNLSKLDTLRSEFFANVSHELRTPLTLSIAPLEELMAHGGRMSAPTRDEFLRTIYANQLRLLKLINNLLDLARLDEGKMGCTFQLEDVVSSVRFYVSTLAPAAKTRRLDLSFEAQAESLPIFVDHEKFEKIVMNLLSNAFKFTPPGGRIAVAVSDDEHDVLVQIDDTGVGIAEHVMPRIFERFSQADVSDKRQFEGSGLGLAVVKEYVAMHSGGIEVHSAEGQGTSFVVRLPKGDAHLNPDTIIAGLAASPDSVRAYHLADAHLTDAPLGVEPPEAEAPSPPRSPVSSDDLRSSAFETDGATVLVVDDVADMRRFLAHILGKRYRVLLARDGLEGLRRAREERPDLIVSDVMMPRMTGYELCQAIRADPELSRTPLVLLSAKTELARKLEGLEHGADDFLIKPFNASELLARVRNLIRIHHQERELINALRALEERERIVLDDLRQAREFQQSILPEPPHVVGLASEVLYQPLDLVGGDIYDLQALEDGRLRGFIADAAGHGVQASLTTMLIKSEYEFAKSDDAPPGEILARLNDRIASTYSHLGMRFTAACFEVDKARRRVRYASGAHPSPLLVHHGKVRELEAFGPFLGVMTGLSFEQHEAPFGPGDRVYLYTDGVTEEWNARGEAFGEERLVQALEDAADQGALAGAFVYDRVCRFIEGGRDQYDDMTLLGVWWGQPPGYDKEKQ